MGFGLRCDFRPNPDFNSCKKINKNDVKILSSGWYLNKKCCLVLFMRYMVYEVTIQLEFDQY